jgi:hypothetical protein
MEPFIKIEINPCTEKPEEPYDPTIILEEFIRIFRTDPRMRQSHCGICPPGDGFLWLTTNCTLVHK